MHKEQTFGETVHKLNTSNHAPPKEMYIAYLGITHARLVARRTRSTLAPRARDGGCRDLTLPLLGHTPGSASLPCVVTLKQQRRLNTCVCTQNEVCDCAYDV